MTKQAAKNAAAATISMMRSLPARKASIESGGKRLEPGIESIACSLRCIVARGASMRASWAAAASPALPATPSDSGLPRTSMVEYCGTAPVFDPNAHPRRLNLGCGFDYREGFLNIDLNDFHKPDLVADVRNLHSLPSDFYEELVANDVLEHLERAET